MCPVHFIQVNAAVHIHVIDQEGFILQKPCCMGNPAPCIEQALLLMGKLYLNTELRLFVTEIHWPIPANFGVLGIADVGRVFVEGESSRMWHTGFGGGIWFGLLRSGQGLNVALVEGESLRLYISTGFILKKKRIF